MRARQLLREADSVAATELRKQIRNLQNQVDRIVTAGGKVGAGDPLAIKIARLRGRLSKLSEGQCLHEMDLSGGRNEALRVAVDVAAGLIRQGALLPQALVAGVKEAHRRFQISVDQGEILEELKKLPV